MHTITVVFHASGNQMFLFPSHELAKSAYDGIRTAMENYMAYSNDKEAIVSLPEISGSEATLRVAAIYSVAISNNDGLLQDEYAAFIGRQSGIVEAAKRASIEATTPAAHGNQDLQANDAAAMRVGRSGKIEDNGR